MYEVIFTCILGVATYRFRSKHIVNISDCAEIYSLGHRMSGVHWIQPHGALPLKAFCEMTGTEGWTIIFYR